jgi:hypothetical protein
MMCIGIIEAEKEALQKKSMYNRSIYVTVTCPRRCFNITCVLGVLHPAKTLDSRSSDSSCCIRRATSNSHLAPRPIPSLAPHCRHHGRHQGWTMVERRGRSAQGRCKPTHRPPETWSVTDIYPRSPSMASTSGRVARRFSRRRQPSSARRVGTSGLIHRSKRQNGRARTTRSC